MQTEGLPGRHPGCAAACATLPTLHAHALVLRSWVGNLWSGVQRTAIRRAFEWCALCPALACLHASAAPCSALLRMLFPPLAPRCMRALGPPAMHALPGISALPIALLFSMSPLPSASPIYPPSFGEVRNIVLQSAPGCSKLRFAFVELPASPAESALEELDGLTGGRLVARAGGAQQASASLLYEAALLMEGEGMAAGAGAVANRSGQGSEGGSFTILGAGIRHQVQQSSPAVHN